MNRVQNYASNFWCYDSNRNVWTEKKHTNLDEQDLVKLNTTILICTTRNGLMKYDVKFDRWTKVIILSSVVNNTSIEWLMKPF